MEGVAPRIWRIGPELVNSYLVEDGGSLVIVDAGAPRYWQALLAGLTTLGRTLSDVSAVLLTHAHVDHIGFAERARQRGVPSRVHELDAALARGDVPNAGSFGGPKKPMAILRFMAFAATNGLLRVPRVREVVTFGDGATLDVPGAPRVIHVPGHSAGSAALHFAGHDALFVGDAMAMYAFTTARVGPQLSPFNLNRQQALASLARLEDVPAGLVLPGHGAAWREGAAAAVEAARRASRE